MTVPPFTVNGITADFGAGALRAASGAIVPLRPQAFAVLHHLAANPGRLVTRDALMAAVWPGLAVTDDSLVQCIHDIRRALRDDAHAVLKTVPRRGYLLEPPPAAIRRPRRTLAAAALLALVVVAATGAWWGQPRSAPARAVDVAVLPFRADPDAADVAELLAEDLAAALTGRYGLRVVARDAVAAHAGPPADLATLVAALGVDYVVEGRIEAFAGQLQVTAQLVDAAEARLVWSERYQPPPGALTAVRETLAAEISGRVGSAGGAIWRDRRARLLAAPPERLTGFELAILSKGMRHRHDAPGVREMRAILERAVADDPNLVRIWMALAATYREEALAEWGEGAAAWQRFAATLERAAAVDPEDGKVLTGQAVLAFRVGAVEAGRAALERALATHGLDAAVLVEAASMLPVALGAGEAGRALALLERARRLEPVPPADFGFHEAQALFFAGREPEAVAALRTLPAPWFASRLLLALALARTGDTEAARAESAEILRLAPDFTAEAWLARDAYQPGSDSAARVLTAASRAGLPICAADASGIPAARRLPDCEAARTG